MADLKISQLTGATTPLAGTEVLPIVQSGSTKQVSVANLTAGRSISVSSLTATGNIGAANMSVSDSNWIGWGNYNSRFTGSGGGPINVVTNSATAGTWDTNQNYTFYVGNLIQGTAAKGVNFTANTPAAGMTSQLLNWYEEGTFTPTLLSGGAAVSRTYSQQQGNYTRIGNKVLFEIIIVLSAKGSSTGSTQIGGLPFTSANSNETAFAAVVSNTTYSGQITPYLGNAQTIINVYQSASGSALVFLPDTGLANNSGFWITGHYRV